MNKHNDLKPSEFPCNCPWTECPEHRGQLCNKQALMFDNCGDPDCTRSHLLGDGTLGTGIGLCDGCANHLLKFFTEDIINFMGDFDQYVPHTLDALNRFVARFYRESAVEGWKYPQRDAAAVLAFAYVVVKFDTQKTIPVSLLLTLRELQNTLGEIIRAYQPSSADIEKSVKEKEDSPL